MTIYILSLLQINTIYSSFLCYSFSKSGPSKLRKIHYDNLPSSTITSRSLCDDEYHSLIQSKHNWNEFMSPAKKSTGKAFEI